MPLLPGKENIGANIRELTQHGSRPRSHDQIVAIALANAARHPGHAMGGGIGMHAPRVMSPAEGSPWWTRSSERMMTAAPHGGIGRAHFSLGGMMPAGEASPWWERSEARQIQDIPHGSGLIDSSGAGRTDRLPLRVPSESHIVPSDVMSALNQGNSKGSDNLLYAALGTGPYGTKFPKAVHGKGPPSAPHIDNGMLGMAEGGDVPQTSILAAGGEMVLEPWEVEELGQRGIERGLCKKGETALQCGHRLVDEMIDRVRKFAIDWLKHAPPPKR